MAVAAPPGWTDADTARVRQVLARVAAVGPHWSHTGSDGTVEGDDHPRPVAPRRLPAAVVLSGVVAVVAAVLVAWNNLLVPALPADPVVRMIANVAGVVVLVLAARAGGLSWRDLGLCPTTWRAGLRWGGAAVGVAALGYAVAFLLPATRPLLENPGVEGGPTSALVLRALLLIPVGTVLCEELAFRGVLHGLTERAWAGRLWAGRGRGVRGGVGLRGLAPRRGARHARRRHPRARGGGGARS